MLAPKTIIDDFVSKLRAIPALVALMESGLAANISGYHDEWPTDTDLLRVIREMKPGRIIVAHASTGPGNVGALEWWRHRLTIYLKPLGLMSDAWYQIINGIPTNGDGLSMLLTGSIAAPCRRIEIPSIERRFIAPDINNPFFLIDYFEITWTFGEGR